MKLGIFEFPQSSINNLTTLLQSSICHSSNVWIWQPHRRPRAFGSRSRLECKRAAVRFGNLTARAQGRCPIPALGREERHEEVGGVRQARSFIVYIDRHVMAVSVPADTHGPTRLQRRIDGVAHEIDQQLLELIGIGLHGDGLAMFYLNRLRISSRATRSTSAGRSTSRMLGRGRRASAV
jgi:hypothetical protein